MNFKKNLFLILSLLLVLPLFLQAYVWEGFEGVNMWLGSVMKDNAVNSIDIASDRKSEGEKALKLIFSPDNPASRGSISREGIFDLSRIKSIQFDVYTEKPIEISLAVITGAGRSFYESKEFKLKRGWNSNLEVKLTEKEWKSSSTQWKYDTKPDNLKETKGFVFNLGNGNNCEVCIDNIRLNGDKIENIAYAVKDDPLDVNKMEDEYSLLEMLKIPDWATREQCIGVKKKNDIYSLGYKEVNNNNKAAYQVQMDMDWREYSKIIMKLNNESSDYCCLALGIQTSDKWVWYESPQYILKPKKSTEVIINLNAPYFKTEKTTWNFTSYLYNKDNVKNLIFLIYGLPDKNSSGSVVIEKFQLLKGKIFLPSEKI